MSNVRLSVTVLDGFGFEATTNAFVQVPSGATVAQIDAAVQGWLALLNAVTAGQITACNAAIAVPITGFSVNDPSNTNLDPGGALKFPKTANDGPWDFIIPDVKASVRVGNRLDNTEGSAVDLLADAMETGITVITGTDGTFTTRYWHALTGPADTFLTRRQLVRGIRRKSYGVGV